jgi:hypothetical protein
MRDPTFALIEHHRACAALAARTGQQRQEMEDSLGDPWGAVFRDSTESIRPRNYLTTPRRRK